MTTYCVEALVAIQPITQEVMNVSALSACSEPNERLVPQHCVEW